MLLTFQLADDFVKVKIAGANITFTDSSSNFQTFVPIECLKLKREGILKEHPDLKDLSDGETKIEAIKRFKEHIKKLGGENAIKDYLVADLGKHGYVLKLEEKEGFRMKRW